MARLFGFVGNRADLGARVLELGREIAIDYAGLEPLLVAPLKSSAVFLVDLSRALRLPHTIDLMLRMRQAISSGEFAALRTALLAVWG